MLNDTIAAVSTPRGRGGVALLRVCGPDAVGICEKVFFPKNKTKLSDLPVRTAVYGEIFSPDKQGEWIPVDDGIATVYRAPASFTGENTVEICCHGGILLTETVLTALFYAGARPAEAGEFTKRAFLNGKMGLSAAEALGNILEAQTKEQISLAHSGMQGRVEKRSAEIYTEIKRLLASVYVKIDYPDEDLADMSREEIQAALSNTAGKVQALINSYHTGHAVAEGISTVICGKPNVGKSSLYNCILGHDAAIVTDIEGTTRDVLTETAALGKVTLRIYDTAGIHDTDNRVEQIGIQRAEEVLQSAELVFAVFDGSRALDEEDLALIKQIKALSAKVIALVNKADASIGMCETYCKKEFEHVLSISAKQGTGMAPLTNLVERLFINGEIDIQRDAVLTNARQLAAAMAAKEALDRAEDALARGLAIELCCADAELAMSAIASLDGREVSEDIVSEIFSHFCVGK